MIQRKEIERRMTEAGDCVSADALRDVWIDAGVGLDLVHAVSTGTITSALSVTCSVVIKH